MRTLSLGLTAAVVLGLVAGCTSEPDEPEVSTVGTLDAEDLGPGEWEGPIPFDSSRNQTTYCGWLGQMLYDPPQDPVAEGSVVWTSGEILVESVAYYFGDDRAGLDEHLEAADFVEDCVRDEGDSPSEPEAYFTWERSGDLFVVHERNGKAGYLWDFDAMMTATQDTFVAVMVSYPQGTTGYPDVAELLDRAVEASAELPAFAEQEQGATEG